MATHKAAGSSKNNRESHSKRLGQKLSDGQYTNAGQIIFRQRGTKIHPGNNVGIGGDDTLFALISGYVKYETKRNRKFASVYSEKTITKSNKQK
ncbi:50S ribosomal protein L27 [Metamycoplasma sualvi]|uniref:50S ribosomal protein L27 n=1 Tax=Metamycoplasma sualvi TaxID=2125 RepID=UPI003872CA3B